MILNFDTEGGCFLIYEFHRDLMAGVKLLTEKGDYTQRHYSIVINELNYKCESPGAVFHSLDKIGVLDQNKELAVCNFDGSNLKKFSIASSTASGSTKKSATSYSKVDMIFPAPLGKILVFSAEDGG